MQTGLFFLSFNSSEFGNRKWVFFVTAKEFPEAYQSFHVGRKYIIFKHYLILLLVNQMSSGLFRFIDALGRNMIVAITLGSLHFLMVFALGGFILAQAFGKARANVSTENEDDVELSAVEKESTDEGGQNKKKGMILPFAPHSITFNDVKYSVDMPQVNNEAFS
ncbi:hypothetical protein OSB04_030875 [Centaurea solstitialis]|uniref:Uncharacterized protein n=1 Tax=Centaurea solstitialis TaxID=347529 RepID=A0AA38VX36_9ASTR|nr:hypothetical protein OSB04_030875 [Centaurea solstitialis]